MTPPSAGWSSLQRTWVGLPLTVLCVSSAWPLAFHARLVGVVELDAVADLHREVPLLL